MCNKISYLFVLFVYQSLNRTVMRTQEQFYPVENSRQTRNKALAIYIATITLIVVSYSLVTAVSVL